MSDGGKGSAPRPYSVDQQTYAAARERVSGKAFAEASELFNDIESIKVRIRQAEGKYQWMGRAKG